MSRCDVYYGSSIDSMLSISVHILASFLVWTDCMFQQLYLSSVIVSYESCAFFSGSENVTAEQ